MKILAPLLLIGLLVGPVAEAGKELTGLDFFSQLGEDEENYLEKRIEP